MLPGWLYREFDDPIAICISFVKANISRKCYRVLLIMLSSYVIETCYRVYVIKYVYKIYHANTIGYAIYTLSGYAID
jgi:hypothetical protein